MSPVFRRTGVGQDSWIDLFVDAMLANKPVILNSEFTEDWESRSEWVSDCKKPSLDSLSQRFGDLQVPVVEEADQCNYIEMPLCEFAEYFANKSRHRLLYAKDWHFQRDSGCIPYRLPLFLQSDWFNNEKRSFVGDYRFVYIGVRETWTRFHCDVMNSYSWSANICGRKLWYFVPPGGEEHFRIGKDAYASDIREHRDKWQEAGVIELIQEEAEIVFVPSSWFHQVHNLEDTISINHNFINASNVDLAVDSIRKRIHEIVAEIEDSRDLFTAKEFSDQVQLILKADSKIDLRTFAELLDYLISDRSARAKYCWVCPQHPHSIFECKKNPKCLKRAKELWKENCSCGSMFADPMCPSCLDWIGAYELSCCIEARGMIETYKMRLSSTFMKLLSSRAVAGNSCFYLLSAVILLDLVSRNLQTRAFSQGKPFDWEAARAHFSRFPGGAVTLTTDDNKGLATIELNHPGKKNALSGKMMVDLDDCVRKLESWDGAVVVLSGANGDFCTGGDLEFVKKTATPQDGFTMCTFMGSILIRLRRLPAITIAKGDGYILGGGSELFSSCDIRTMNASAKVGFVQGRLGVTPGWGGTARMVEMLGRSKAIELLATASVLDADTARNISLTSFVYDTDEQFLKYVSSFLRNRRDVVKVSKHVVDGILSGTSLEECLEIEREDFIKVWGGEAHLNALTSKPKHK
uniref:Jumonji domain-containing protein 4 n=1 Tax=Steinernema glaseri TaxID=37863 RepID=A0A1I7ZEE9_9BILA